MEYAMRLLSVIVSDFVQKAKLVSDGRCTSDS